MDGKTTITLHWLRPGPLKADSHKYIIPWTHKQAGKLRNWNDCSASQWSCIIAITPWDHVYGEPWFSHNRYFRPEAWAAYMLQTLNSATRRGTRPLSHSHWKQCAKTEAPVVLPLPMVQPCHFKHPFSSSVEDIPSIGLKRQTMMIIGPSLSSLLAVSPVGSICWNHSRWRLPLPCPG